jgi:hypothetical protein
MKLLIYSVFLMFYLGSVLPAAAESLASKPSQIKVKFPFVSLKKGDVGFKNEDVKSGLKELVPLTTPNSAPLELRSGEDGQARLELDPNSSLILLENSEIQIPKIDSELGLVSEVFLVKGRIRIDFKESAERSIATLISRDAFKDCEALFEYNPATAKLSVFVFTGALDFRGFEGERKVHVGPHQRAEFQGVLEEGAPAFDVLLKGRKVARGSLSEAQNIADPEFALLEKSTEIQRPPPPKPPPKPKPKPGQICVSPFAKLDECVWRWTPKTKECRRQRCAADGQWIDSFVYPADQGPCEVLQRQPKVGICDF